MFVALAETLHFGRAARNLGIGQPNLTRGIQKLEADLGVELFVRSRRSVRLSTAGQAFRQGALELIDRSETLRRAAQESVRTSDEHCILGICVSGGQAQTGRLVAEFRKRNPEVRVQLRGVPDAHIASELAEGKIHAVVSGEFALPHGCDSREIHCLDLAAAVPANWDLAKKSEIIIEDLDDLDVILPCRREQPFIWDKFKDMCASSDVRPRLMLDTDSLDQVFGLVAGGAGMSLFPMTPGTRIMNVAMLPFRPRYPVQYRFGWRGKNVFIDRWLECLDSLGEEEDGVVPP